MNETFRLTNNLDELADVIKNILKDNIEFMIWQNIDSEKNIIPGFLKGHIQKKESLFIDFEIKGSKGITEDEKIFLFCKDLNILVKGRIKHLSTSKIQIKVDKKFYLHEQRKNFRMDVTEKEITLKVQRRIEQTNTEKEEQVKLKDLSNGGCGFLVSSSRAINFQKGNTIVIKNISSVELDPPIAGAIAQVTPIKSEQGLNNKLFLVGIKFDELYPNIDHLLQMVEFEMH